MISQLASVFSSRGVVMPTTEIVGFPQSPDDAPETAEVQPVPFPVQFEQASARLELSALAVKALEEARGKKSAGEDGQGREEDAVAAAFRAMDGGRLTPEEKEAVERLKARDREVRAHEKAHLAAAGGHAAGGASYEYRKGPDGKAYAVGGHVSVETGPVAGSPEATLQKARALQRSASAPADPSGADAAVAADAARMAAEASRQLAQERSAKAEESRGGEDRARNPYAPYSQQRPQAGRHLDLVA